jgi:5'-nucleotidase
VIDNPDKGKTLVVQSWEGEKVLGRVQVTFDGQGRVKKWSTSQPILVDESVPEDPAMKALVAAFQKPILQQRDRKVAVAGEALSQNADLGPIIADGMVAATTKQGVVAALMNTGGVRASLEPGDITYGAAISVQPFNNTLVVMDLTGAQLKDTLEIRRMWPSAALRYNVDPSKPQGSRITELTIDGRSVDPAATYRIVTNNFMAGGGDDLTPLKNSTGYRYETGIVDIDAFVDYLAAHSPVTSR